MPVLVAVVSFLPDRRPLRRADAWHLGNYCIDSEYQNRDCQAGPYQHSNEDSQRPEVHDYYPLSFILFFGSRCLKALEIK